jgi:hypothetical protein
MNCTICRSAKLTKFLSLGHQPPSDAFLNQEDLEQPEITYPLDLFFCPDCALVQLGYAVDPEILFRDYVYNSGTNNSLKVNFAALVKKIVSTYGLTEKDLAVDIGSNDGTLLQNYIPHNVKILGIDPSSSTSIAVEKGIPTVVDFFNRTTSEKAALAHGKAKVITATNVFAHVVDLDSFMEGIISLLADDGIFITESGYVVDMIEGMQYDSIYHEHLRYYGIKPLLVLFERYNMEIIDIERISTHGGSIRVYAAKKDAQQKTPAVTELLRAEKAAGYHSIDIYRTFAKNIINTKFKLLRLIFDLKKKNAHIVGIGAPAKGNTLLNFCKIDSDLIDYLTEKSALKIGMFSPGMHIPVIDESRMFEEQPEYALILSWNIAEELKRKLRDLGYKGKFIIPNPSPLILED